jgi:hypothetical protein
MSTVVVTGYIPLISHYRPQSVFEELGQRLLNLPLTIHAQLGQTLEDCWLWPVLQDIPSTAACCNPNKDTLEYHVVQHQKVAWLCQVADKYEFADTFVWMDYGILHIPGITEQGIIDFVNKVDVAKTSTIDIPGCWRRSDYISMNTPCWRFCGTVLVCPKKQLTAFDSAIKKEAVSYINETRKVSWEVNTWAMVENKYGLPIRQYHAVTHDQRMLTAYDERPSI